MISLTYLIMKRLLTFLFCALSSLLFGCNTTPDPVLTVTPENLAFSAEGGAQTVQVKANNPWTASASGSGLSVNPSSGDGDATVTVTATATSSTNPVSRTVVFRSEGLSATVSVTQDERKVIQVGDVMVIPAEGGTFAVDIQYNTEYTVEVEASAKSWISFLGTRALQSGKLEFQFAENQNTEPRTGKVTVRDNSGKAAPVTLNFVQEEKKVITVGDVMTIPAEGGTFAVDIQYNTDFDVVVESGAQSWITFVATRALQSGKLEFRFAENQSTDPRQGKVTVKDKSGKVSDITLTFVQAEKKVIAVGDVMEIPAEGGTFAVDVQYNTDVVVEVESAAQSWIHFVAVRALTSGKLEFSFDANPNPDVRTGKVTVKDKNGKVSPITLTFVQAEKKVIAVGDVMEIPAEGGTFSVDVQYNTDVVVEVESAAQSWIHFVAVRALTSGKLEFSFDANPNPDVRTGKVTVKDKNGKVSPITLTFVQAEKKVINIGEVNEIPEEGGLFEVDIQYNTDFEVIIEEAARSWVTFVATRSLTSGKLQFQIAPNDVSDIRTTVVDVKDKTGRFHLGSLTLKQASKVRRLMMEFYSAMDGPNWTQNYNWGTDAPLDRWCWVSYDGNRYGLYFREAGLKGEIPEMIGDFGPALFEFLLNNEPGMTGTLPMSFAKLTELTRLWIVNTSMTSLPDVFSGMKSLREVFVAGNDKMGGPLPLSIGESSVLELLNVFSNRFTGELQASWARLGKGLRVDDNCLTGKVPKTYIESEYSRYFLSDNILYQKPGYGIDVTDVEFYGYKYWPEELYLPGETAVDLDGNILSFEDIVSENKYTVYIFWATWCPFSKELMPQLRDYYEKYQQDGLEVIATIVAGDSDGNEPTLSEYVNAVKERGYDKWYNFYFWQHVPRIYPAYVPIAEVYGSDGRILFSSFSDYIDPVRKRFGRTASSELMPFLESLLGPATGPDVYTSTDYSKDGEVITLQRATVGKGIDIVFMGDGYVDKDMGSGGLYETVMRQAMEEYFAIEPYKTFRNRFNVYAVKAVSKNDRIGNDYTTALGSYHGNGSYIGGDIDKCYEYALKVPGITSKEGLLVSVLVNSNKHGGTAHLNATLQSGVAFYPSFGNDPDVFGPSIRHEAGGHGFAFLADEYSTYSTAATPEHIAYYNEVYNQYGWFANVDFTNDKTKIRWSSFLSDDRYKNEVGIFEGGALYSYGAYRPSQNSMMRDNLEYFNAPSRWAIYQQIMKRSGESYSFQKFLEYDAVNRAKASQAAARPPLKAAANGRKIQHSAPPVIIK